MEAKKTPEQFLQEMGIEMQKTTLISCIDGVMKQPSLSYLMQEYAKYVVEYSKESNDMETSN
jgi:hypothetical protein